jgi:DHA1 family bicyclomycin/chloramphenicol resistance-like MFS transporter
MFESGIGKTYKNSAFVMMVCGTVLGIAGTDLVLPAVPGLPEALGGTQATAQFVLAAYVVGAAFGLLVFGELGARFSYRPLLVMSLIVFSLFSFASSFALSISELIALRFVQGAAGAAPAVFAPGVIRALFTEAKAINRLGLLGSIESLVPALAPIAATWLLWVSDWRASFLLIGSMAAGLALLVVVVHRKLPEIAKPKISEGYMSLLRNRAFLQQALSQACTLGGLLIFVFGAPVVITSAMKGTLADFITMQVIGIAFFIAGANVSGRLAARFRAPRVIMGGSLLSALGLAGILLYALVGGANPFLLAILSIPMNLGLGFRGPTGFMQAIVASRGNDARGSAVVMLAILIITGLGIALAAPFITLGLVPLSAIATATSLSSVLILLPKVNS